MVLSRAAAKAPRGFLLALGMPASTTMPRVPSAAPTFVVAGHSARIGAQMLVDDQPAVADTGEDCCAAASPRDLTTVGLGLPS